ncbi:MAG: hypothetical protein IKT27_03020 [Clostridia bacterium]|nr:hypothetical protein [Clostridia bacterium]
MNKEQIIKVIQGDIDNQKDIFDIFYIKGLIDMAYITKVITQEEEREFKEQIDRLVKTQTNLK